MYRFIFLMFIGLASQYALAEDQYLLKGTWFYQKYADQGRPSIYPSSTPFLSLSIELNIKNDESTIGEICYITQWGNRIDCPIEFQSILKNDEIVVQAKNTWGGTLEGKIKIEDCGNILYWKLKKRSGEGHALTEGYLQKSTIKQNHMCQK